VPTGVIISGFDVIGNELPQIIFDFGDGQLGHAFYYSNKIGA